MSSWLDKTLAKLLPSHTKHVIASDPDGILGYHEIGKAIENSGITIFRAASSLEARVRFELDIRDSDTKSVLVINAPYQPLPDILNDAYLVTISYKDIFPYFDPKALAGLSYNSLSALYELRPYDTLSYDSTLKFLLENLYHIDLDALNKYKTKERVLATLIEVVFHKDTISVPVTGYLRAIAKPLFPVDIENLLVQTSLKEYLQKIWNLQTTGEETDFNFNDPLLAKSLGNLFVTKTLTPVKVEQNAVDEIPLSLRMGVYVDESAETRTRILALADLIQSRAASIQDQFSEWHEMGKTIGEAYYLALQLNDSEITQRVKDSLMSLNNRFQRFVNNTYWSLFSLSGSRCPAVITRVLDYMHAQQQQKKALIVIDGMSTWQWHAIMEELSKQEIVVNQMATLAYLPSITAWSRQALLKGAKPDLDKDNSGEDKLFREYWVGKGYHNYQIGYQKFGVDKPVNMDSLQQASIVALVCNDIDDLMHGAVMGDAQLLQDTQQWVQKSALPELILELKSQGYSCFVTTDHGNIEAGAASTLPMSAKNLSTSKSKRHIRFVSTEQAEQFQKDNLDLAVNRRESSLFLTDDTAFIKDGKVITHGGSHVLEMIIPLGVIE